MARSFEGSESTAEGEYDVYDAGAAEVDCR